MPKREEYAGQVYEFPDDATDAEIAQALGGLSAPAISTAPKRRYFNLAETAQGVDPAVLGPRGLAALAAAPPLRTHNMRGEPVQQPQEGSSEKLGAWDIASAAPETVLAQMARLGLGGAKMGADVTDAMHRAVPILPGVDPSQRKWLGEMKGAVAEMAEDRAKKEANSGPIAKGASKGLGLAGGVIPVALAGTLTGPAGVAALMGAQGGVSGYGEGDNVKSSLAHAAVEGGTSYAMGRFLPSGKTLSMEHLKGLFQMAAVAGGGAVAQDELGRLIRGYLGDAPSEEKIGTLKEELMRAGEQFTTGASTAALLDGAFRAASAVKALPGRMAARALEKNPRPPKGFEERTMVSADEAAPAKDLSHLPAVDGTDHLPLLLQDAVRHVAGKTPLPDRLLHLEEEATRLVKERHAREFEVWAMTPEEAAGLTGRDRFTWELFHAEAGNEPGAVGQGAQKAGVGELPGKPGGTEGGGIPAEPVLPGGAPVAGDSVQGVSPEVAPPPGSPGEKGFISAGVLLPGGEPRSPAPPLDNASGESVLTWARDVGTGQKQKPTLREMVRNAAMGIRTGIQDRNAPAMGKDFGGRTMKLAFSWLRGSEGRAEGALYRFRDAVLSKTIKRNLKDFSAYLELNNDLARLKHGRLAGTPEEAKRVHVGDLTEDGAKAGLSELRKQLGEEKWAAFEKAGAEHQKAMREALKLQVTAGNISQELYDTLVDRYDFYSPRTTLKWLDVAKSESGSLRSAEDYVKSLKGVEAEDVQAQDMLTSSVEKIAQSRRLADENMVRRKFANEALLNKSGLTTKVNPVTGAPLKGYPKPEPGYALVKYRDEGVLQAIAVPAEVADVMNNLGAKPMDVTLRYLGWMSKPFRIGATGLSLGFNAVNQPLDVARGAALSKYGAFRGPATPAKIATAVLSLKYFRQSLESTFHALSGSIGKPTKTYMEMLDSGILGGTFARDMFPESFHGKLFMRPKGPVDMTIRLANALDESSKILQGMRGKAEKGTITPEVVYEARTFGGTPDALIKGNMTNQFNTIFSFFNVRLQGTVSDVGRLMGADGAKPALASWASLGTTVGLGSLALALHNRQPDKKKYFDKIPRAVKEGYFIYMWDPSKPENFFTATDGSKQLGFFRFPKKEIFQVFGNLVDDTVDFAFKRDPKKTLQYAEAFLSDLAPLSFSGRNLQERVETVGAQMAPPLKAPMEYAFNRDLSFHRAVVPDYQKQQRYPKHEQYTQATKPDLIEWSKWLSARGVEVSPAMTEKLISTLSGPMLTQFVPSRPIKGLSKWATYPITRRFLPTPAVDNPLQEQASAALDVQGEARSTASRQADEMVLAYTTAKAQGGSPRFTDAIAGLPGADDPAIRKQAWEKFRQQEKELSAAERLILKLGVPNGARAKFLSTVLSTAEPEARPQLIETWKRKRLVNGRVLMQLNALQRAD